MSPMMAKLMVMFVLTIIVLVLIVLSYLVYKNWIRPLMVRLFMYQKVLKTIEVIVKSEGDSEKKIEGLINEKVSDLDLIRVAELEILKSKVKSAKIVKEKSSKLSLLESLKVKWRNFKSGKKKSVQQVSGEGSRGIKEKDADSGTGPGTEPGTEPGIDFGTDFGTEPGNGSVPGSKKSNSGDAEQRSVQGEPTKSQGKRERYFD